MNDCPLMRSKVIVSGDRVEVYDYKNPVPVGFKRDYEIKRRVENENEVFEKRKGNLYRARKNVREIIWSNQTKYTKFVTLTYAETVLDVKKVRRDITTFVQAMRRLNYDMKYLYVLENQKERGLKENNEGCIHVHMLLFFDKFITIEDLNRCWKHGETCIEVISDIRNLGAYVCKYITKDNFADWGKQSYGCSNGLKRPETERFYTDGYSDTDINFQPEEVKQNMNIDFWQTLSHDYIDPTTGKCCNQKVKYTQGSWKDKNIIKERDKQNEFT